MAELSKPWWTQKSRVGAKRGQDQGSRRRPELPSTNRAQGCKGFLASESSLGTAPLLPGTSCPGPQLARAHAEPRPGAVPGHSRCPDGSRVRAGVGRRWAGGMLGPSRTARQLHCESRAHACPSSPAWHGCLRHLHGIEVPASQAGSPGSDAHTTHIVLILLQAPKSYSPWALLTLRVVGGASGPFAIWKHF